MVAKLLLCVLLVGAGGLLLLHGAHHCRGHLLGLSRKTLDLAVPGAGGPAPTCDSLDCPPFTVVHEEADYQIRDYNASTWAETEPLLDASFDKATGAGFRSLFQYIQGKNEKGVHIPMTAPVLTAIKPSGGPFCSSTFTVKFFVPPLFSQDPPVPSVGLGVNIVRLPRRCVAVRSFSGFATDFNVAQEAKLLADSLERTPWANITSSGESYSIAQYNSPFELFGRVNEVWVPFAPGSGDSGCSFDEKPRTYLANA